MKNAPSIPTLYRGSGEAANEIMHLLGRRWTLRILYELYQGPLGFRELRAHCEGMSTSVLSKRLRELTAEELVVQSVTNQRYLLTRRGEKLTDILSQLNSWAETNGKSS